MEKIEQIEKTVKEENIEFIRWLYIDVDNIVRGTVSNAKDLKEKISGGLSIAACMQSAFGLFDRITPDSVFGFVGEVRLMPDPETFRIAPYAENSALMICDQYTRTGEVFRADPRPLLKEVISRYRHELKASFENEFYLFRKNESIEPFDRSMCYSTPGDERRQRHYA